MNDLKLLSVQTLLERLWSAESASKSNVPSQKADTQTNFEAALSQSVIKYISLHM